MENKILVILLVSILMATTIGLVSATTTETLRPDQDLTPLQWGIQSSSPTHSALLARTTVTDTSFNYLYPASTGTALVDTYGVSDMSSGFDPTGGIDVSLKVDSGSTTRPIEIIIVTHGNQYSSGVINLYAGFNLYVHTWNLNPNTGSEWTSAEINDLQVIIQADATGTGDIHAFQLFVTVRETPALPLPESPFGALAALCSVAAAFVTFKFVRDARLKH